MLLNRSFISRLLTLAGLGVVASPAIMSGCGNSNTTAPRQSSAGTSGIGGSSAGNGGTSGSASGGRGAKGGTSSVDGGEAGESTEGNGGTGGSAGAMAGRGGQATGGSAGAMAGREGQATGGAGAGDSGGVSGGGAGSSQGGAGQAGGGAGQSGAAGNGTAGMVGVLGTPCSPPGALACAGNYQKLSVLCGGDGEWEPNQTCAADQYCDSTPGQNVGLCQPIAEGCEAGPGAYCSADEQRIVTCGPDAVTKSEESCDGACHRGVCRDDREACPNWDQYDYGVPCAKDCGEPDSPSPVGGCFTSDEGCYTSMYSIFSAVVRSPWSDDVCACETVEGRTLRFFPEGSADYRRVTVPEPWSIGSCGEEIRRCAIVRGVSDDYLDLWTPALDSGPVNILVEEVGSGDTCPE
jgi:hypothetical protein